MKLQRSENKDEIMIPTSAMGDIAFLLIIFFMVASTFVQEANVQLEQAKSEDIENMEPSQVSLSMDKEGVVRIKGQECEVSEIESMIMDLIENQTDKTVMVKIDKNLKQDVFGKVMLALSKAGAEIALIGEKE